MLNIFDVIRQSFLSFFSGSSATTRGAGHPAHAPGRSPSPAEPKYAGKSASELTHALKVMGKGDMARGIQQVQRKGVFQGKNLGKS
jgi:hypothetical protein